MDLEKIEMYKKSIETVLSLDDKTLKYVSELTSKELSIFSFLRLNWAKRNIRGNYYSGRKEDYSANILYVDKYFIPKFYEKMENSKSFRELMKPIFIQYADKSYTDSIAVELQESSKENMESFLKDIPISLSVTNQFSDAVDKCFAKVILEVIEKYYPEYLKDAKENISELKESTEIILNL